MWNLHIAAYCLMANHYHKRIENLDAKLTKSQEQT